MRDKQGNLIRYKVLQASSLRLLEVDVQQLLDEFPVYEPAGGPFTSPFWSQAVFLKEPND